MRFNLSPYFARKNALKVAACARRDCSGAYGHSSSASLRTAVATGRRSTWPSGQVVELPTTWFEDAYSRHRKSYSGGFVYRRGRSRRRLRFWSGNARLMLPNVGPLIPIVGIKHSCRKDRLIVASVPLRIRRQPPRLLPPRRTSHETSNCPLQRRSQPYDGGRMRLARRGRIRCRRG
jgi:hypothetical protein